MCPIQVHNVSWNSEHWQGKRTPEKMIIIIVKDYSGEFKEIVSCPSFDHQHNFLYKVTLEGPEQ